MTRTKRHLKKLGIEKEQMTKRLDRLHKIANSSNIVSSMSNTKWKHLIEDLSAMSADIHDVKIKILDKQGVKPIQNLFAGALAEDIFFESMEGIFFYREIEWVEFIIENRMDQLPKNLDLEMEGNVLRIYGYRRLD